MSESSRPPIPVSRQATSAEVALRRLLAERIAILDGAMGTTIRTYGMKEADIRGERFATPGRIC